MRRRLSGSGSRSDEIRRGAGLESRFDERVFNEVDINFGVVVVRVVVVAFAGLGWFRDRGISLVSVDFGPETKFVVSQN